MGTGVVRDTVRVLITGWTVSTVVSEFALTEMLLAAMLDEKLVPSGNWMLIWPPSAGIAPVEDVTY